MPTDAVFFKGTYLLWITSLHNRSWTSNLEVGDLFDLIISNPPYVSEFDYDASDLKDPPLSLLGGRDGLDCYRTLAGLRLSQHLRAGGHLLLEVGFGQAQDVCAIFEGTGEFSCQKIVRDYGSVDRVVVLKANNSDTLQ